SPPARGYYRRSAATTAPSLARLPPPACDPRCQYLFRTKRRSCLIHPAADSQKQETIDRNRRSGVDALPSYRSPGTAGAPATSFRAAGCPPGGRLISTLIHITRLEKARCNRGSAGSRIQESRPAERTSQALERDQ